MNGSASADQLARLAAEASPAAAGLEVRALVDAPGGGFLLLLAPSEGDPIAARVALVAESGRARVHLVPSRPAPKPRPAVSGFTRDARPWVEGTRLLELSVAPGDRTVIVRLDSDGAERRIVAELFGATPNLLIVDEEGVVRSLTRRRKGRRPQGVGAPYLPPPPSSGATTPAIESLDPPVPDGPFGDAHPLSAAIDAIGHSADLTAERDLEATRIEGALRKLRKKADALCDNLARQLAAGEEAEVWRHRGDLLSAAYGRIKRGMTEVTLDDFEGGTETVPLDPKLDTRGNVEACYKRARKLARAGEGAGDRLEAARARAKELSVIANAFEEARSSGAPFPDAARALVVPPKSIEKAVARTKKSGTVDSGLRRFLLSSGYEILVGKSNKDNDRLTLRVANGNDLWMHVHGDAGSHVVLRQRAGRTPSLDDLLDAASLAVHFSKRRGAEHADVIYTPRKWVRKRKGMAAGAVTVDRHETLHVTGAGPRARSVIEGQPGGS